MPKITYALEAELSVKEFKTLLIASTLGEHRPDEERLRGMKGRKRQ